LEVRKCFATLSSVQEPISPTIEHFTPIEPMEPIRPLKPTPNDPPWKIGAAFGMWVASVLLILLIPALFLAPYAVSIASQFPVTDDLIKTLATDPIAIALQVIAVIPAHLVTILLAWILITQGRKYSFTETIGWQSGGMRWWHYVLTLIAFFALAWLVGSIIPEQETELTRILKSSRYAVFLVAFMATFTAPLVEEVVYRGILYSALQKTVGVWLSVAIVTGLFIIVHVPQYFESAATLILLSVLSLVLTAVRALTSNLWPCVVLHTLFNGIQAIGLIAEMYVGPLKKEEVVSAILILAK